MTVSMLTTRLSSVITGCGSNDTACSRMSCSCRSRSTNGITIASPGRERARVPAESLDDSGPCLRDHADRLRQRDEDEEHDDCEHDQCCQRSAHCGLLFGHEGGCPLDLDDIDARCLLRPPDRRGRCAPTTPRRRCAPGRRARRSDACTTALRPTSASVPVRESAGMRTCRRAIGRRKASEATEATMKTIRLTIVPPPNSAASAAAPAARATGPRKKRPGVTISPIPSRTAMIAQISHAGIWCTA